MKDFSPVYYCTYRVCCGIISPITTLGGHEVVFRSREEMLEALGTSLRESRLVLNISQ